MVNQSYQLKQSKQYKQVQTLKQIQTTSKVKPPQKSHLPSSTPINNNQPFSLKSQLIRLLLIPLLIILFLLIIQLTFKSPAYQYNDYFYSKNIEINRKIRGVVPPLNQSKEEIYGQYNVGLIQSFTTNDRNKFQPYKINIYRNDTIYIYDQHHNCQVTYLLKFYSNTVFVQKINQKFKPIQQHQSNNIIIQPNTKVNQSTIIVNESSTILNESSIIVNQQKVIINKPNSFINKSNSPIDKLNQSISESNSPINKSNTIKNESNTNNNVTNINDIEKIIQNKANSSQYKVIQSGTQSNTTNFISNTLCKIQDWQELNQILYKSHIWTFSEENFYFMSFSRSQINQNQLLILHRTTKYQNV